VYTYNEVLFNIVCTNIRMFLAVEFSRALYLGYVVYCLSDLIYIRSTTLAHLFSESKGQGLETSGKEIACGIRYVAV